LTGESLVSVIASLLAAPGVLGFGGLGGHGVGGGAAGVVLVVGLMGMRLYMRSRGGGRRGPRGRGPWR
jgi:hypothetical protein